MHSVIQRSHRNKLCFNVIRNELNHVRHASFGTRVPDHMIKSIPAKTGIGIYGDLSKKSPKFYKDVSDGLILNIDYADFNPSTKPDKTVFALHGAPGDFHCFNPLGQYFYGKNIRVIAPNMPSFSHTRQNYQFWHSSTERLLFIKDFLKKLGIEQIDCLVSHSFGLQTTSYLWDDPGNITIKSVALFGPQPLWNYPPRPLPARLFANHLYLTKYKPIYKFLEMLGVYRKIPFPMKLENLDQLLYMACIQLDTLSSEDLPRRLLVLRNMNLPTVVLNGLNDGIIPRKSIEQICEILQIDSSAIVTIDPQKDDPESIELTSRRMLFDVKQAKHFVHTTHYAYANRLVECLLNTQ